MLERREPDNHDYQIRILSGILLGAFSGKLNHEDVIRVFHSDESLPTLGLLAAVALQVHDPADTWFALKECAIAYASYAQLDSNRQDELLNRFTFGPAFGAPAAERRAIAKGSSPASDERARGSGIEAARSQVLAAPWASANLDFPARAIRVLRSLIKRTLTTRLILPRGRKLWGGGHSHLPGAEQQP